VIKRLTDFYREGRLGHFYLLTAPAAAVNPLDYCEQWWKKFFDEIAKFEDTGLRREDVLELRPEGNGAYTIEHPGLEEWFRFADYAPVSWRKRFVVVFEAHRLSETVQNKLLKLLEEPHSSMVILLFRPRPLKLLKTVESRAQAFTLPIEIDVPVKNNEQANKSDLWTTLRSDERLENIASLVENKNWFDATQMLKDDPTLEEDLMRAVITYELNTPSGLLRRAKLINALKWASTSQTFHGNSAERLCQIFAPYHAP
jgi:hypothetical protein